MDKTFYDEIIENEKVFDKAIYILEKMATEAPNTRTRYLAQNTITHIRSAVITAKEYKKYVDNQSGNQNPK